MSAHIQADGLEVVALLRERYTGETVPPCSDEGEVFTAMIKAAKEGK